MTPDVGMVPGVTVGPGIAEELGFGDVVGAALDEGDADGAVLEVGVALGLGDTALGDAEGLADAEGGAEGLGELEADGEGDFCAATELDASGVGLALAPFDAVVLDGVGDFLDFPPLVAVGAVLVQANVTSNVKSTTGRANIWTLTGMPAPPITRASTGNVP